MSAPRRTGSSGEAPGAGSVVEGAAQERANAHASGTWSRCSGDEGDARVCCSLEARGRNLVLSLRGRGLERRG